jgi:hypothetical protein
VLSPEVRPMNFDLTLRECRLLTSKPPSVIITGAA